jgi:hypothetical protein
LYYGGGEKGGASVKLKPGKSFLYHGMMDYLVVYDERAAKKQRYTVMVLNVEDPVIVGRGVSKRSCLEIIAEYEVEIQRAKEGGAWYGDRTNVLDCVEAITCRHRQKNGYLELPRQSTNGSLSL